MVYQWKNSAVLVRDLDPQIVGERIEKIAGSVQEVTREDLLADAKNPKSPLHDAFEWDDKIAGHQFRLQQAGYILRALVVVKDEGKAQEKTVRAFVNVREDKKPIYVGQARVLTEEDLRLQVVGKGVKELLAWCDKYEDLAELSPIAVKIRKDAEKLTNKLEVMAA